MKNIGKKVIIMMLALSMAVFSSIPASAQTGAGTIAGVSTATIAVVGGIIIAGLVIAEAVDDDEPTPVAITSSTTTTTTTTQGSGSTTTTTTN